jgi:hypothetical protein
MQYPIFDGEIMNQKGIIMMATRTRNGIGQRKPGRGRDSGGAGMPEPTGEGIPIGPVVGTQAETKAASPRGQGSGATVNGRCVAWWHPICR